MKGSLLAKLVLVAGDCAVVGVVHGHALAAPRLGEVAAQQVDVVEEAHVVRLGLGLLGDLLRRASAA